MWSVDVDVKYIVDLTPSLFENAFCRECDMHTIDSVMPST